MKLNYKQLSDTAYALHQQQQFDKAEKLYLQLLTMQPEDSNVLNLLGLLYISKKQEEKAIKYLTKAFVLKKTPYIASNLAKAYYFNNEYTSALKIFNDALSLQPSEDIYYSIALTYKKMKKYTEAIENYNNALKYNKDNYKTYYNLSLAYKELNDFDNALLNAEKSALLCDADEEVYTLLSGYYEQKKDYNCALKSLKKAAEINPRNHLYFFNLGVLYSRLNNDKDSVIAYNTAIMLQPSYIEAYVNISSIYKKKNVKLALSYLEKAYSISPYEENLCLSLAQLYKDTYEYNKAIDVLEKLLSINRQSAESYSLLSTIYMDLCDYEMALDNAEKALAINPSNNDYKHSKAIALKYLGQIEEGKKILNEVCDTKNPSIQSEIALGMMYLTEKNFEKGISLYRKRSKNTKFSEIFKTRIWSPNIDVTNKTILLYSDCGLGDTIMYSRYLPLLEKKCERVILQTDKDLVKILQLNFPDIEIIKKTDKKPKYDYVMPIMDIQLALNLDFDNIPSKEGYLTCEKNSTILNPKKKKVGLFWQGNRKVFKNRSLNFDYLKQLLNFDNIEFYSFQVDKDIKCPKEIVDLSKNIKDYSDTASLLLDLDLLITIDSSIAHMAGALGVKTFLLLPKTSEWRWFNDNDKCSWYDSIKIFKQETTNDWENVISRIEKELNLL